MPHDTTVGQRRHASHPEGLPVLHTIPLSHMPSPLPRRNRWVRVSLSFPNGGGLPRITGGSASALPFSRPAQRSLHVTACTLAESLTDPFTSEASAASLPPPPFRLLPAGTTLAGWDSHPLGPCTFARRTEMSGLGATRWPARSLAVTSGARHSKSECANPLGCQRRAPPRRKPAAASRRSAVRRRRHC